MIAKSQDLNHTAKIIEFMKLTQIQYWGLLNVHVQKS